MESSVDNAQKQSGESMKTIRISGRDFRFVGDDIESSHYHWVIAYLWPCKVEQVVRHACENDDAYALRIYTRIAQHPEFFKMLGGLIVPAELLEVEWSPWVAIDTGKFLSEISDIRERVAFTRQAVDAVISFCLLQPHHLEPIAHKSVRVSQDVEADPVEVL
jgi:hypothetical protein